MAALIQIMACCRTCNKPLSDPMMVCFTASLIVNVLMLDYGTSITKLQKILQPLTKPLIYTSPDVNGLTEKLGLLLWVLYYYSDLMLWQCYQPMAVQLFMKAGLRLAKILATVSCSTSDTAALVGMTIDGLLAVWSSIILVACLQKLSAGTLMTGDLVGKVPAIGADGSMTHTQGLSGTIGSSVHMDD